MAGTAAWFARPAIGVGERVLRFRWPIDLRLTVASHGWAQLAPWRWDPDDAILARRERIGGRLGRWLSVDWEPFAAIAALRTELPRAAALIARGGGRILRCSSFYEDFVKTVLTINTSWSGTRRMAAALVAEPGGGAFPEPGMILDYGEARLRERAKLGFRAATLLAATRQMLEDGAIGPDGEGRDDRLGYDYLLALKGIGPYAAAHCRVLLQDFARIPIDATVVSYLRERQGCKAAEFAARHAACGPYLALGYRLLRLSDRLTFSGLP